MTSVVVALTFSFTILFELSVSNCRLIRVALLSTMLDMANGDR